MKKHRHPVLQRTQKYGAKSQTRIVQVSNCTLRVWHIKYVASDVNKRQQPARDMGTKTRDSSKQSIQPAIGKGTKNNPITRSVSVMVSRY